MPHILCVSIPRSGHHLLEYVLRSVLQDRFLYCEFYTVEGCCRSIPCTKAVERERSGTSLFMQKSHDRNLSDPLTAPGTYRVVQYRAPIPVALSDYELYLAGTKAEDNLRNFRWFLAGQAIYFIGFYQKWLKTFRPDFFYLGYEQFVGNPVLSINSLLHFAGVEADERELPERTLRVVKRQAVSNRPFTQRDVYSHQYASAPTLQQFESLILTSCPGYYPARYFDDDPKMPSELRVMYRALRALAEPKPSAAALEDAKLALDLDPNDPKLKQLYETVTSRAGT